MGKLNIQFHNPNTEEDTIKYISRIFMEASRVKFENALKEAVKQNSIDEVKEESPKVS